MAGFFEERVFLCRLIGAVRRKKALLAPWEGGDSVSGFSRTYRDKLKLFASE